MSRKISVDNKIYQIEDLSEVGQKIVKNLLFSMKMLNLLSNNHALLIKAKNAYVSDLNAEIVQSRSGIDMHRLLETD
jgi:hypothetical protein